MYFRNQLVCQVLTGPLCCRGVPEQNFCAIDRVELISNYVKKLNFGEAKIDPIEVFTTKIQPTTASYNSQPSVIPKEFPVHLSTRADQYSLSRQAKISWCTNVDFGKGFVISGKSWAKSGESKEKARLTTDGLLGWGRGIKNYFKNGFIRFSWPMVVAGPCPV